MTTIKVGTLPIVTIAFIIKPSIMPELNERNIELELTTQTSGSQTASFVAQGNVDIGAGAFSAAVLNAFGNGLPLNIVAPQHAFPPASQTSVADPFVAIESSGITSPGGYEGRKLAISNLGGAAYWMLGRVLDQADMTVDDVDIKTMPFPDEVPAMKNGAVVGGLLPEPLATLAESKYGINYVGGNYSPENLVTALMYNTNWAEENPDVAQDFMDVYLKGVREIQDNWTAQENIDLVANFTDIPAKLVKSVLQNSPPYCDPNLQIEKQHLLDVQEFLIDRDQLGYDEPIPYDEMVNTEWADNAVSDLGEV